jgi:2-keto-4-pentenoate hydratase/2-oxohepta-3-ene-1,7-dioic acid hydratase in catechol pathway
MAGLINPRQIYAFGLNYVDHAKESNLPLPTEPFFFLKAASSLQRDGGVVEYPPSVQTLFYETELGVVIGAGGRDIAEADAMKHVAGACGAIAIAMLCYLRSSGIVSLTSLCSHRSRHIISQATCWPST